MGVEFRQLPATTVVTANTAVKLPVADHAVKLYVTAGANPVYVGDSTVTTGNGLVIAANTTREFFAAEEMITAESLWVTGATAGSTVTVSYLKKVY